MGGDLVGLVAVVLTCGIPLAMMYTYYRVRSSRAFSASRKRWWLRRSGFCRWPWAWAVSWTRL